MPERVVDRLEPVEIDEQHGNLRITAAGERRSQSIEEERAVGEPREWVMQRLMTQPCLAVAQRGDRCLQLVQQLLLGGDIDRVPVRSGDRAGDQLHRADGLPVEGVDLRRVDIQDTDHFAAMAQRHDDHRA